MQEVSYLKLHREGRLAGRVDAALDLMKGCRLCPRRCGCDRPNGETGFCRGGRLVKVASFGPHFGEEPPLVGLRGSGTIFLSSCNLLCSFCQNYGISHGAEGVEVVPGRLAQIMIDLKQRGCHNINFVTPTHYMPQILEALVIAVQAGLDMPLVYNCGGYESVEALKILEGIVDIYMPDFKFWDNHCAERACGIDDYRERAREALREMHRQVGDLEINADGIARRGLLVRHLVMPNNVAGSRDVLKFLADEISRRTYVNIMDQYRPCGQAYNDPLLNRRITADEYRAAIRWAREAGLERFQA
ncbi:MAG: radical SAM protein [Syntrophaceae bacterium]